MAIAGKVAITPKGNWSASTAYQKLDLVYYNNASYVATKPSTGITPTNTAYWMLVLQSAGEADLEGIINGTTQVGNAKTLDGHGAEYFASLSALANYLPINGGGTLTGNTNAPLVIANTADDKSGIQFRGENGSLGFLGLFDKDVPSYISADGQSKYPLLHTGNKPTGTYTGNGSATQRTINVGGIGDMLLIYKFGYSLIVTPNGAFGKTDAGSFKAYTAGELSFSSGILTIATADEHVNQSGIPYPYQVL